MKLIKLSVCAVAFLLTAPIWATTTTIWGGFEDTTGSGSDYDYNDLVFSISGNNLTLSLTTAGTGTWQSSSGVVLGTSGSPFWNDASFDGPKDNIGYCIYGGGSCNGGVALDAGANFLATTGTEKDVNDVYFSVDGQVGTTISLTITSDTDTLGWELIGSNVVHTLGDTPGSYSFTPGGDFQLVGIVNGNKDYGSDSSSQFAFFESPAATPEPSSLMLLGSGLLGMAGIARRRFGRK